MVKIHDKDHFQKAFKLAKNLKGKTEKSFRESIQQLNQIRLQNEWDMYIAPDFVAYSFMFSFYNGKQSLQNRTLNGGMTLHGLQETYSVELNPPKYLHWRIHT